MRFNSIADIRAKLGAKAAAQVDAKLGADAKRAVEDAAQKKCDRLGNYVVLDGNFDFVAFGPPKPSRARGQHTPCSMNKTEKKYADHLEGLRRAGAIECYDFEAVKLRLAKACFYTPDFLVINAEGFIEMHEVKGFWEDDARVKIKVAARTFPYFKFVAIQLIKGDWKMEEF